MHDKSWKKYATVLLCILIPATIVIYCFILPSEERKLKEYNENLDNQKEEQTFGEADRQQNEDLIQEKESSYFSRYITKDELDALNKSLSIIDSAHENDIQKITSIFLEGMGYPSDLIKVEYYTNNGANFEGDVQAGTFMPSNGKLSISQKFKDFADIRIVIGVVRHELDHFDKFAKLCKSIGVDNFQKIYGGNIDREFWESASAYADTTGFDKNKYRKATAALNEYSDITSFYQVFVEKSNDVRNPFELTAYAFSDYVNSHYKIKDENDTNVKKVAKVFNQADWQIYRIASKNKYLTRSRSAIFDYYFLRAMMSYNPSLQSSYQNAVKNGNITGFWEECEKIADGLKNNVLSVDTTDKLIKILNTMNLAMNEEVTNKEINGILQLKYITLKDAARNRKFDQYKGNIAVLLGINVNDYLDFLENSNYDNGTMQLKLLASKYWLSSIKVQKQDGKFYDFTNGESTGKIAKRIEKNPIYQEQQKSSGMSESNYFQDFITKNKLFP